MLSMLKRGSLITIAITFFSKTFKIYFPFMSAMAHNWSFFATFKQTFWSLLVCWAALLVNTTSCRPIQFVITLVINKSDSVVRFCYHSYDYKPNWTPLRSCYHYLALTVQNYPTLQLRDVSNQTLYSYFEALNRNLRNSNTLSLPSTKKKIGNYKKKDNIKYRQIFFFEFLSKVC